MIITRISGGLGNQMFQYAIARSLAQRNDDVFKLDLSFYPKQSLRKYELNLFKIDETIAMEKECVKLRGSEGLFFKVRNKLNLPANRPIAYAREKQNTVYDKGIYTSQEDIYLDGFWQNEKYFTDIREELIREFTPTNRISEEAQNYVSEIESTNSVSLHVRRGDYVADAHTNNVHGVCDMDYYKRAIGYINKNVSNPIFYIFSDDIVWCKENFDFLENKVFVDDTKSAIDDLELMKRCKHNIIANSTFSWWGAWLNRNKKKIIIAPSVWWAHRREESLVPESWIKISSDQKRLYNVN